MSTVEPKIPGISLNHIVPTPELELLTGVPVFFGLTTVKLKPEEVNQPNKPNEAKKLLKPQEVNQTNNPNQAKKLTLATHFQQYFQDTKGYLADVIKGFFDNGGRLCYVIALTDNTVDALQQGLEASEVLENVDLVCVPDIMRRSDAEVIQMQQAVLEHCNRVGDRFAILDALNDVNKLNSQLQALSSRNGALYAPWLKVESYADFIPPCGHIAGIYASCDRAVGVHSAPANIPLQGVLDLSFSLTPAQQAQLNPTTAGGGINCIRSLQGRGMRIWGVRTLSPIPEWQYVNVRRLFITLGRWANLNLADTVFEPNAFSLWVRLQRELSIYCESLWRQGALQGATPQEAFYVKCDAETNPPENRETGQVVVEIGLAPTIPGEFIQLLIVQSNSGITIT